MAHQYGSFHPKWMKECMNEWANKHVNVFLKICFLKLSTLSQKSKQCIKLRMGILRISKWGPFSTCLQFREEERHNCILPTLVLSVPEKMNWSIPVLMSDTWKVFTEVNIDVSSSKTFISLTFYLELSRENASLTHTPSSPEDTPVQEMWGNKPNSQRERTCSKAL